MRIVRVGQPGNLYRLQRSDLPRDKDLRQSFLNFVDLSGLDLSEYDLRDADIISCKAHNVTLGEGKTKWMMSRFTDWLGTTLPEDASSHNPDFALAHNKSITPLTAKDEQIRTSVVSLLSDGSYLWSWSNLIPQVLSDAGATIQEALAYNQSYGAKAPNRARFQGHIDRGEFSSDLPLVRPNCPHGTKSARARSPH